MSVVANVAINVDSSGAVSKLRQVQTQAQATERAFGALSSALGALGVGLAFTKVIADVKELDTNIRRLGTVGVDVGKISPALSNLSKELGGVASKAELAAASYQAASAGFSDTAGNINILNAATKAAVGGLADTQAVTEILVKTLNAYGMSGNQALQVTDSISKAVELGNQEWSDYTSQLGRVASIAALAGVSLDEVNAFIAAATKNGATAEIAFTGLGATLNTLLQPTKESQEAAAKLGIQWNYGGLQAKGFSGLMAELAVAMNKDKEATVRLLGSQEAMRGAMAAASKNGTDFKNILNQIGDASGKTDMDFQTMKGSLENTLKALDTAFKNLSEALGKAFGPTLVVIIQDITQGINGFAGAINAIPQPVMIATGEIVKLVVQILLLQKAIEAIIALRAGFAAAMLGMTASTVASGTAVTASAGAFALYTNNTKTLQAATVTAIPIFTRLRLAMLALPGPGWTAAAIVGLGLLGKAVYDTNETFRNFVDNIGGVVASDFKSSVEGMTKDAQTSTNVIQVAYNDLSKKLKDNTDFVSTLFNQLFGTVSDQGASSAGNMGNSFANAFDSMAKAAAGTFGYITQLFNSLPAPLRAYLGQGNSLTAAIGAVQYGKGASKKAATQNTEKYGPYVPSRIVNAKPAAKLPPMPTAPTGGGKKGGKKGKTDAERAAEKAAKLREEQAKQLLQAQQGLAVSKAELEIAKAVGGLKKIELESDLNRLRIEQEYGDKIKNAKSEKEKIILLQDKQTAIEKENIKRAKEYTDELYRQLGVSKDIADAAAGKAFGPAGTAIGGKALAGFAPGMPQLSPGLQDSFQEEQSKREQALKDLIEPLNQAKSAADALGNSFADAFSGLVSGAMTAQQALATFFKSLADSFLKMASDIIAAAIRMAAFKLITSIFNLSPGVDSFAGAFASTGPKFNPGVFSGPSLMGKAKGGPVSGNTPYMVGERGPELFMPGRSGNIVPNSALSGGSVNVVVNVDANGSSVQGDEPSANQLGRVISVAVQAELVKQQRPGGLLSGTR